jgi:phosphate uptake regulator
MVNVEEGMLATVGRLSAGNVVSMKIEVDVSRLAEDTTELGIFAEDIFKNASASLLFGFDADTARSVLEAGWVCQQQHQVIHKRALELLVHPEAAGEELRRIVETQTVAAEFARIAECGRLIAEQALVLGDTAEMYLLDVADDAPGLLVQLIRQAYVEVRGCVLATTTRDTTLAQRLIREDAELDHLYLIYKNRLEHAITVNPRGAHPLHRLLLVGVHLENIGNHVVSACRALLYLPSDQMH